jgi:hypothetical protein
VRDLAKLRALSGEERRLLAVAIAATPMVTVGLSILGFRRLLAVMSSWPRRGSGSAPIETAALPRAQSVAKVVAIASGPRSIRASCLRRSLLLWWLLRHDGIETVLRVGVNRDGGGLHAHAWVEYLGRPLNDVEDVALRFPPFGRDFGSLAEDTS